MAAVWSAYRNLLALPGAARFTAAAFVMRLPISMTGLGCVLLITRTGGSYGLAGAVVATFWLVTSVTSPLVGRLADQYGQAIVLAVAQVVEVAGIGGLVAVVLGHGPAWLILAAGVLIGLGYPSAGTFVRIRWAHVTTGTGLSHTAYSWEAVLDEVIFIAGPVLVTAVSIHAFPAAGLLVTAALGTVGAAWLAPQRATEPPRSGRRRRGGRSALRHRGVGGTAASAVGLGVLFGSVEVAVVALVTHRGEAGMAGLVLAAFAAGSMLAGLGYGAVRWRIPLAARMAWSTVALTAFVAALVPLPNTAALIAMIFVAGLAVSPALISGFALVAEAVPARARTEATAWLSAGIGLGVSAGAPLVGWVIDGAGPQVALWVPVAGGVCAAIAAAVVALRPPAGVPADPPMPDGGGATATAGATPVAPG